MVTLYKPLETWCSIAFCKLVKQYYYIEEQSRTRHHDESREISWPKGYQAGEH